MEFTEREKAAYQAMSKEDQYAYLKNIEAKKQAAIFRMALMLQLTLESIDVVEDYGLIIGKLKEKMRPAKIQTLNVLNKVYGHNSLKAENIDLVTKMSGLIDNLIEVEYLAAIEEEEREEE